MMAGWGRGWGGEAFWREGEGVGFEQWSVQSTGRAASVSGRSRAGLHIGSLGAVQPAGASRQARGA